MQALACSLAGGSWGSPLCKEGMKSQTVDAIFHCRCSVLFQGLFVRLFQIQTHGVLCCAKELVFGV